MRQTPEHFSQGAMRSSQSSTACQVLRIPQRAKDPRMRLCPPTLFICAHVLIQRIDLVGDASPGEGVVNVLVCRRCTAGLLRIASLLAIQMPPPPSTILVTAPPGSSCAPQQEQQIIHRVSMCRILMVVFQLQTTEGQTLCATVAFSTSRSGRRWALRLQDPADRGTTSAGAGATFSADLG